MNIRYIRNKNKKIRENHNKLIRFSFFILLCIIFMVGIIVGTLYFENMINENKFELDTKFIEDFSIDSLETRKNLFIESMFRNIVTLIFIWIVGLSILGVPILIFYIAYDGFSLGITLTYILSTLGLFNGYSYIFSSMYVVTMLNTLIILLLCYSAVKVTLNTLKQKTNIKSEFIRHSTLCIIMLSVFFVSSLIEIYALK